MPCTLRHLLLAASLAAGAPRAAPAAEPRTVVSFDDAAGDATGPGGYLPPGDTEFTDGDFDLRRFTVKVDGEDVIFEVTLGATFRRPVITQRTNSTPLPLTNGIYLQNVDIYLDTDPAPGSGLAACIPGRRVAFAGGRTWEAAVVLTPQPDAAREVVRAAFGDAAARVIFPGPLLTRGRTVIARVPAAALGGLPRPDWGYSVHVSGARWERTYAMTDRLRGRDEPDAYTMPVRSAPEAWAFGGAPNGEAHPRVVDVLLPPGIDQRAVLGGFDARTGAYARVPFVTAGPGGAPAMATVVPATAPAPTAAAAGVRASAGASAPPAAPALVVVDVSDDLVSVSGRAAGLAPLRLGRVVGADGATLARLVVLQVSGDGLVARVVEGRERVTRGAEVRFDAPPPAAPPTP